jgi:hypothetical protein
MSTPTPTAASAPEPSQALPSASRAKLVPARYIASHRVFLERPKPLLNADGSPMLDAQGKPMRTRTLSPGDIVPMPESDVYGQTYWHDPQRLVPSQFLGFGHVVKSVHATLSRVELALLGYEFHLGRADFQPADAPWPLPDASSTSTAEEDAPPAHTPAVAAADLRPAPAADAETAAVAAAQLGSVATSPTSGSSPAGSATDAGKPSRKAASPSLPVAAAAPVTESVPTDPAAATESAAQED